MTLAFERECNKLDFVAPVQRTRSIEYQQVQQAASFHKVWLCSILIYQLLKTENMLLFRLMHAGVGLRRGCATAGERGAQKK